MALPARLFCDTSFFYACFDQHDVNHEQAKQISEDAATVGSALFVTWDIISETVTLLRYRRTYREALTFLTEVKPHLRIVNYGEAVRTEAEQIFRRYGRDRGAPRAYARGTSPHASSGETLRSVSSFAKAMEDTLFAFIHGLTPVAFCEGG